MIYKAILDKEPHKLPFFEDIRNPRMDQEEDEEDQLGEAMDNFLYGPIQQNDLDELNEEINGVDALEQDDVFFIPNDLVGTWDEADSSEPDFSGSDEHEAEEMVPFQPNLMASDSIGTIADLHGTANVDTSLSDSADELNPNPLKAVPAPTKKTATPSTKNAHTLLFEAQKKLAAKVLPRYSAYLTCYDVWGMLSLARASRFLHGTLLPQILPFLIRNTVAFYSHEVHRFSPYTYDLICFNEAQDRDRLFARRKRTLLHWEVTEEDEIHADEAANPEGYRGATPFNQFSGWEYDEYELLCSEETTRDWNGLFTGILDVWMMVNLVFTACHDQEIMGDFLRDYVKGLAEFEDGRWKGWIGRDVMAKLLGYEKNRVDPWIEDVVRREFGLAGRRQRTMDEFLVEVDEEGKPKKKK